MTFLALKWDETVDYEALEECIPSFSFVLDLVTQIEDDLPILRRLVLVRGLDWMIVIVSRLHWDRWAKMIRTDYLVVRIRCPAEHGELGI